MLNFNDISKEEFLTNYWQKKPLVIRNAIQQFENFLTADDLAGLSMEEEIESRLVFETPDRAPFWSLKQGPFTENDFKNLPETHWTLLVQGVDRFIPEVAVLLEHFDFIPSWRMDDVMISYAVKDGSVGPHYDNYDVFLYQAQGRRKWLLTTKNCVENNYQSGVDLRIMKHFAVENEFILEEGDMLYLPPHVGHHGVSLTTDCMTYSFGYRSYQGQELLDSFAEHLASKQRPPVLYKDPIWLPVAGKSEVPEEAWLQAKKTMQTILDDEALLKDWFGAFATMLDNHAESILPECSPEDDYGDLTTFKAELLESHGLLRHSVCRFAYIKQKQAPALMLYVNGCAWETDNVASELITFVADNRTLLLKTLLPFIGEKANLSFLYEVWKLQWIEFIE